MKRFGAVISRLRAAVPWVVAAVIGWLVLTHRLVSLVPKLSDNEANFVTSLGTWRDLITSPLHVPFRLVALSVQSLLQHFGPVLTARLPAVLFGILGVGLLVIIAHRWYGRRSAVFALAVALCAAYILHIGRFAGYDSEYFAAMMSILSLHVLLNDHEDKPWAWFCWLVGNLLLLTVPGMIWFVVLSIAWQWRGCNTALAHLALWQRLLSVLVVVGATGWLAIGVVFHPSTLTTWLGLPVFNISWAQHILAHLRDVLAALFVHGSGQADRWLVGMPVFDILMLAMLGLGLVFYAQHLEAKRTRLLGSFVLLGIVLASFGVVSTAVVVPLLYIIIIGGLAYGLHFWLKVFPRNQLARYTGMSLLALLVLLSCLLNIRAYFIAWPQDPATRQAYHLER